MKVKCIHKCDYYIGERSYWVSPDVGEVCTVDDEEEWGGNRYYFFIEYPGFGYDAKCFIPLPDTPAEVIEEEETEFATA